MPEIIKTTIEVIDQKATGQAAAEYRKLKKVSGDYVAQALGISQPQISLLESGNRTWTEDLFSRYIAACDSLTAT